MGISTRLKKIVDTAEIVKRLVQIRIFNKRVPVFGSADITNSCNLRCKHCYWWQNRKPQKELSPDEWRTTVRENFIKKGVMSVSLTGGEPLLRPDVIEAILEEMRWKYVTIVTNGTLPLPNFGTGYFVSVDGTESIHDAIRGAGTYEKLKRNIRGNQKESVTMNMTINILNYACIEQVVRDWYDYARALTFQFHTPFSDNDQLWLPYGQLRNKTIDKLLKIKEDYPDFIANTGKQLELFRDCKWTLNCPKWFFVNLDSNGKTKETCIISNTEENGTKPMCTKCGIGCNAGAYSGLLLSDTEWFRMFKVAKRTAPSRNKKG